MYSWRKLRMTAAVLVLCGSALAATGCYVAFANIQALLQSSGNAVLSQYINSRFVNEPNEFKQAFVAPAVTFSQALWGNLLTSNIPQDLPNNTVASR